MAAPARRSFTSSSDDPTFTVAAANLPRLPPGILECPTGACAFRDLTAGHVCGCRRFWLVERARTGHVDHASRREDNGWCYCGHHACYHEGETRQASNKEVVPGSIVEHRAQGFSTTHSGGKDTLSQRQPQPASQSNWLLLESARSRRQLSVASCISKSFPSNNHGPAFKYHMDAVGSQQNVTDAYAPLSDQSSTEIAPSSILGSPGIAAIDQALFAVNDGMQDLELEIHEQQGEGLTKEGYLESGWSQRQTFIATQLLGQLSSLRSLLLSIPNLQTAFSGIHRRLDAVEHVSTTDGLVELDYLETRTSELESKVEELENFRDTAEQERAVASSERSSSVHARDGHEVIGRLDDLETRLLSIEKTTTPSLYTPWTIEVVLLPFGPHLHRVWSEVIPSTPLTRGKSQGNWARMISRLPPLQTTSPWIVPNACGAGSGLASIVHSRLMSRGLVCTISLVDNSAQHLQGQLHHAFNEVLPLLSNGLGEHHAASALCEQFLGLQSPLIPLRKVHKQSQLQYLTPAELVTPVLWTSSFLESSVFMKAPTAGLRRLFMTTPAAYLQSMLPEHFHRWTWQTLQQLPWRTPSGYDKSELASENCWDFDERLDSQNTDTCSSFGLSKRVSHIIDNATEELSWSYVAEASASMPQSLDPVNSSLPMTPNQAKHEDSDEDTGFVMPITPVSVFPTSQSQGPTTTINTPRPRPRTSSQARGASPNLSSSQKRGITSSFASNSSASSPPEEMSSKKMTKRNRKKQRRSPSAQESAFKIHEDGAGAYATPYSYYGTAIRENQDFSNVGVNENEVGLGIYGDDTDVESVESGDEQDSADDDAEHDAESSSEEGQPFKDLGETVQERNTRVSGRRSSHALGHNTQGDDEPSGALPESSEDEESDYDHDHDNDDDYDSDEYGSM